MSNGVGGFRGVDTTDAFFRSLVLDAGDMIVAFDDDGMIGFISPACERLIGMSPGDIIGQNIASFLHPDDLGRAFVSIAQSEKHDSLLGNVVFRLRHADGSWVPADTTAGRASDGTRTWFVALCRPAAAQMAESETLVRLLNGGSLRDALEPVLDTFSWHELGSHVAITWEDDGERQHLSTGLPALLSGVSDDGPWSEARRSGQPVLRNDLSDLDEPYRAEAVAQGRGGYWIVPVFTIDDGEPALITVWTAEGRFDPEIHEFGMGTARRYVDVVLQFTMQRRALDHAASHDPHRPRQSQGAARSHEC